MYKLQSVLNMDEGRYMYKLQTVPNMDEGRYDISESMTRKGTVADCHRGELSSSGALQDIDRIMETDSIARLNLTMLSDGTSLIWCHSGRISASFCVL
jgi:hypothetical protein